MTYDETAPLLGDSKDLEAPPGTPPQDPHGNIQDGDKSVEVKLDFQQIKVPKGAVSEGGS